MIVFPNCKINLGLHIISKRADGFHNLQTVFYPVPLQDALEVVVSPENQTSLSVTGISIDSPPEENICFKAYQLLKKDFPELPPVAIHLHKAIPAGAGLGGGSADGAFMLLLLNKKFHLQIPEDQLLRYALQLGSDCPFFIKNVPSYAGSRGEDLQQISLDLSPCKIALVNPKLHINTGWAFSQIKPSGDRTSLQEIISLPPVQWKENLFNDFEAPVFAAYPEIATIKQKLYEAGAVYASMSGSGSTVYGIFSQEVPELSFPEHYFVRTV